MNKFKSVISILAAVIVSSLFLCCEDDTPPGPSMVGEGIKILPIGDSRVEGARPEFESYRYELWKNLVENNWEFDFVGTRTDGSDYPTFMGKSFDFDHEGTGGEITSGILSTVNNTISPDNAPDVVLLGIGGNDISDGTATADEAISNINQIIDYLQAQNDSVVIFLEQIAPGRSDFMTAERLAIWNQFNNQIPGVASAQTNSSSKVIAIDMAGGWNDGWMADVVHYNEAGAKVVADRYYAAIDMHLDQ